MSKTVTIGELKAAIADMPDEWGVTVWNGSSEEAYWVEFIDTSINGRVEFNFNEGEESND